MQLKLLGICLMVQDHCANLFLPIINHSVCDYFLSWLWLTEPITNVASTITNMHLVGKTCVSIAGFPLVMSIDFWQLQPKTLLSFLEIKNLGMECGRL